MPIHDWTRVDAGLFHHFHLTWIGALSTALNAGRLPPDYFALAEQRVPGPIPDVLTLRLSAKDAEEPTSNGNAVGLAVATAPPRTRTIQRHEAEVYARKANRITIRHRHGDIVAVIEIVSPGNKASQTALRAFVEESADFIERGVHLLVIDLFPPGPRDPHGIHKEIWDEFLVEDFELPTDKHRILVSYDAGDDRVAYVEPFAVGDALHEMPLFLKPEHYVPAPLESSYMATWEVFPSALKGLLEDEH